MDKNKKEVKDETEKNTKADFEIPNGPSWGVRILIVLAVVILIGVVGLGVYLYNQSDGIFSRVVSGAVDTSKKSSKSVNTTTTADINTTAKNVIDSVDTAPKVSEALEPVSATTKFTPDAETIYVTIQTKNLTEAKQIKAEWYYVDEDTFIDQAVYGAELGVNNVAFHLEQPPSGAWPTGKYQIKIYVDGALAQIAQFQVVETATKKAE